MPEISIQQALLTGEDHCMKGAFYPAFLPGSGKETARQEPKTVFDRCRLRTDTVPQGIPVISHDFPIWGMY